MLLFDAFFKCQLLPLSFIILVNIFGVRTQTTRTPITSATVTSKQPITNPKNISILKRVSQPYAPSSTIRVSTTTQKPFKRTLPYNPNRKENATTLVVLGKLSGHIKLLNNGGAGAAKVSHNDTSDGVSRTKVLKRTQDNETTTSTQTCLQITQACLQTTPQTESTQQSIEQTTVNTAREKTEKSTTEDEPFTKKLTKEDLHIGTMIVDHINDAQVQFVEIPIKRLAGITNISDEMFESLHESMPDKLDFSHQKIYCGKEAAERLKNSLHGNNSLNETR